MSDRRSPTGWYASPSSRSGSFPAGSPVLAFETTPSGVRVAVVRTGPNAHNVSHYTTECICLTPERGAAR